MAQLSTTKSLLLEILERCTLFVTEGTSGPYAAVLGREAYEEMLAVRERKFTRDALRRLREQKLIKLQKRGDQFLIVLTKKGQIEACRCHILTCREMFPLGTVCLVSFDFPQDIRWTRDAFRGFLKFAGFKQAHQSVWVSRKNVCASMRLLVKLLRADDWIKVYESKIV